MTAALDRATSLIGDPQVQAFLHVIGAGESGEALTDADYRVCNVGPPITQWKHPWYGRTTTEVGHSTATGAFQFLGTSFEECADALGLGNDFSPVNQQLAAVWTIDVKRRSLAEVQNGDIAGAIHKLATEWVSLPGLGLKRAQDIFQRYGGVLVGATTPQPAPAPPSPAPAPTPTPTRPPMDPLSLISLLTSVFSPLLRAKLDKVVGTDIGKPLVDGLLAATQQLTGKADPLEAVAVARQQPAVMAQLEAKTEDWFKEIAPAIDKIAALEKQGWDAEEFSRTAAADRGAAMQAQGPLVGNPQFLLACVLIAIIAFVVFSVLWKDAILAMFIGKEALGADGAGFSSDMQAFVIGALVGGALTALIGYFYGSTRQSAAKDITIDAIARQGKR